MVSAPDAVYPLNKIVQVNRDEVSEDLEFDVIIRDEDGNVSVHYLLAAVLCDYVSGTPLAADDVLDAAWVPFEQVRTAALPMSDRVAELMEQAIAHSTA